MKVGDRVIITKKAQQIFNTKFNTGVVKELGQLRVGEIRVKRDNYLGHEQQWWASEHWRKMTQREKEKRQREQWPSCSY